MLEQIARNLLSPTYKKLYLSLFAESIIEADKYGPNKWGCYYSRHKIRHLVGNFIVCTIDKRGIWLALSKKSLTADVLQKLNLSPCWTWDTDDYPEYTKVPSKNGYYKPNKNHKLIWPIIRTLHYDFILSAANQCGALKITSQKKHSSELIKFLRIESGKHIPMPVYCGESAKNINLPKITAKESVVQGRIGQTQFRDMLIDYWKGCAVTGCKLTSILIASHIKPWHNANNSERLDKYNGLLLLPNLDKLFDSGLITFDDNGKIIISKSLSKMNKKVIGVRQNMQLKKIAPGHVPYLQYHKRYIFID